VYANDCAYLAARWCASCVTYNASRVTGTDAAARRSVSIAAAVSPLTGSGDRAIRALVARTRAEIFHALDGEFLVIFGYFLVIFWLFLVIFGYLHMGNVTDGVFCFQIPTTFAIWARTAR
jgi:hypothetical protein